MLGHHALSEFALSEFAGSSDSSGIGASSSRFLIAAPYPNLAVVTTLPNPNYNDPIAGQSEIVKHISVNGTIKTFIKRKSHVVIKMTWQNLSSQKLEELVTLLRAYSDKELYLEIPFRTHAKWRGFLMHNPFQSAYSNRKMDTISLEFELRKVY